METNLDNFTLEFKTKLQQVVDQELSPYDLKELLLEIRDFDEDTFKVFFLQIPNQILAETLAEFPDFIQEEITSFIDAKKIASIATKMDTDDAADLIRNISENDEEKAEKVLKRFENEDREVLEKLISYDDNVAGAYMQSEVFSSQVDEVVWQSIERLRQLKKKNEIDSVHHVFVTNENKEFICSVGLEELVICDKDDTYLKNIENGVFHFSKITANHNEEVEKVVEKVSDYNLSVIPVVDDNNILVGRITSDDIYDLIEEMATEDIYNMAGVNAEVEEAEDIFPVVKSRAFWLFVNLLTAIAASYIISLFDTTIQAYVALAILMPIIASMGGNAGTQSLTVTVRQLAIGEIDSTDAIYTIKKEVLLSLINGVLFSFIVGAFAYFWFQLPKLGLVVALSVIINLFFAGLFGAVIPLSLEKLKIDPAIASSVLLTTVTDIVGFFAFLGLAKIILF